MELSINQRRMYEYFKNDRNDLFSSLPYFNGIVYDVRGDYGADGECNRESSGSSIWRANLDLYWQISSKKEIRS